jgi:Rieske Fe-S protein
MTEIAKVSDIGIGAGRPFHDPSSGNPAWLVRTESGAVAFSAVCTHAGCPVDYQQSAKEFVCPCHGGTYSATTGAVLGGPPPSPLPAIAVKVVDGRIYVR